MVEPAHPHPPNPIWKLWAQQRSNRMLFSQGSLVKNSGKKYLRQATISEAGGFLNLSPNNNNHPPNWIYLKITTRMTQTRPKNPRFSINEWSILGGRSKVFGFAIQMLRWKKCPGVFARKPVEGTVVCLSHYLQGLTKHSRCLALGFVKHENCISGDLKTMKALIPNKLPIVIWCWIEWK